MKIRLICIQKNADNRIESLIEDYQKRLTHYISFQIDYLELPKKFKKLNKQELLKAEGELILANTSKTATLVLLDDKGKSYDSVSFSKNLQSKLNASTQELVFCIGGAYGFSEEVHKRSNEKLSLSKMTLTHQMVRLFFVEQLYRAFTILKGEKYHH
jgi:23S rRNA (pseudouridine1915-N3)-methyltransferase